jgi:hypothetical protein
MDPGTAVLKQQPQMDAKMDDSSDGSVNSEDDDLAAEFEHELMNM